MKLNLDNLCIRRYHYTKFYVTFICQEAIQKCSWMAVALVPFAQPIKLSHRSCDQRKILPSISYLSSRDFILPLMQAAPIHNAGYGSTRALMRGRIWGVFVDRAYLHGQTFKLYALWTVVSSHAIPTNCKV